MSESKRVVIVGGVAAGASVAARLRRLDEKASIIMIERGKFVSFANCGLPYYVGNEIESRESLLVATPEVDRAAKKVYVVEGSSEKSEEIPYDYLVLATGASPIKLKLPGFDREGIFSIRTIPDVDKLKTFISEKKVKKAAVIGAGFIGMEIAEQLQHLSLDVAVIELAEHVLPPFDAEISFPVEQILNENKIRLILNDAVEAVKDCTTGEATMTLMTKKQEEVHVDLVIACVGVLPETSLAKDAGLELGVRGTIKVDDQLRSSDPNIFACGDNCQVLDFVTRAETNVPLAGPAQRQGRILAEAICGGSRRFRGTQMTAVVSVFGRACALTGESEGALKRQNAKRVAEGKQAIAYQCAYIHPGSHAGYYPGARKMVLKLIFESDSGKILGAQGVGTGESVPRRIDVISMAIQSGSTVRDLAEAELCYSPQFGSAKDPVNILGMVATNALDKIAPLVTFEKM